MALGTDLDDIRARNGDGGALGRSPEVVAVSFPIFLPAQRRDCQWLSHGPPAEEEKRALGRRRRPADAAGGVRNGGFRRAER